MCDAAGLPHCSAHGLRKAGAAIAAENGASVHELMAIFGWLSLKQAELCTRAAQQKRLANRAMKLLIRDENENVNVSHRVTNVSHLGAKSLIRLRLGCPS